MQKAACVVVGAGPAGSSAAFQLARAGVEVLLLDKASFPRGKVCGDGLTPATSGELEHLGLREQVLSVGNPVTGCVLYGPDGSSFEATSKATGHVVARQKLDELLYRRACEAGAKPLHGVRIVEAAAGREGMTLTSASGERYLCELAVVASGAHSSLPLKLGLQGKPASDAVARRGYFEGVEWKADRLMFCYAQDLLPGYGWIFPMGGGRANVGVGYFLTPGKAPELDRVWTQFHAWLRREGIFGEKTRPLSEVGTAQLRMGLRRNRLYGDRVLLAGDAAAAINPLSGEGVSQALRTGRLAAQVAQRALRGGDLTAEGLSGYAEAVHGALPWIGGYQLTKKLFGKPALVNAAVAAARESPQLATALYETIIGVAEPKGALLRCAVGVAGTYAGRWKRAAFGR